MAVLVRTPASAFASTNNQQEQALIWSLVAGNVLDVVQTSQFHDRGLMEGNPLFQEAVRTNNMTSIILTKTVVLAAALFLMQGIPQEERIQALTTANGIQWGVIMWNELNGGGLVFRVPLAN